MANTNPVKLTTLEQLKIALLAAKGYTDAEIVALGLGSLATKSEVGEAELSAALKAVIDAKAEAATLATLIGEDTGKTARAISAEEVAKVVAKAPENFDTLKEIADWIASDTTGAAKMANDINALNAIVDGIGGDGEQATVVAYIANVLTGYVEVQEGHRLMTEAEGTKLAGIAEGATKVEKSDTNGNIKVDGVEVKVFTPAVIEEATADAAGLMSAADKKKLDGMTVASDDEINTMVAEVFPSKG